jgi:hypothetical protein
MEPDEFLVIAGECTAGTRQVDWRVATIAAYYAAFHVGRRLLQGAGFRVAAVQGAHRYLQLRLQYSEHPDITLAADRLDALRRLRNTANYDLDYPYAEVLGIRAVSQSLDIMRVLRDLQNEPAILARVVDAIRDYERRIGEETWHAP